MTRTNNHTGHDRKESTSVFQCCMQPHAACCTDQSLPGVNNVLHSSNNFLCKRASASHVFSSKKGLRSMLLSRQDSCSPNQQRMERKTNSTPWLNLIQRTQRSKELCFRLRHAIKNGTYTYHVNKPAALGMKRIFNELRCFSKFRYWDRSPAVVLPKYVSRAASYGMSHFNRADVNFIFCNKSARLSQLRTGNQG